MFAYYSYQNASLDFTLDLSGWQLKSVTDCEMVFYDSGSNARPWEITIPKTTTGSSNDNTEDKWYTGTGAFIEPYEPGREFTVAAN